MPTPNSPIRHPYNIVTKNQTPHGRDNASYQHIESDFSRVILFRITIVGISPCSAHSEQQEKENSKDQEEERRETRRQKYEERDMS